MSPWSPALPSLRPDGSQGGVRPQPTPGPDAGANGGFGQVWTQIQSEGRAVTVQKGDTLVGLVTQHYKTQGMAIDGRRAYREALQLAKDNGIANANLILPGDAIRMGAVALPSNALSTLEVLKQKSTAQAPATAPLADAAPSTTTPQTTQTATASRSLLDQTLQRAVEKGYVSAAEVEGAKTKVQALSEKFGFEPDHFAMLTLMESGGMNPQASNGRCHGIIQFCEGQGRGAASVGMAGQAKRILGMGLLGQLDLVERYFQDIGLEPSGKKMSLDDLYLSVLTPAARKETRRQVPLPIAGRQAQALYASGSVAQGITRDSIVAGLMSVARQVFPDWQPKPSASTQVARNDASPSP